MTHEMVRLPHVINLSSLIINHSCSRTCTYRFQQKCVHSQSQKCACGTGPFCPRKVPRASTYMNKEELIKAKGFVGLETKVTV